MGVSTGELGVFSDNSMDYQVNPLSEQFTLPFSDSSDFVM
jgi:hypothetical protein